MFRFVMCETFLGNVRSRFNRRMRAFVYKTSFKELTLNLNDRLGNWRRELLTKSRLTVAESGALNYRLFFYVYS